MACSHLFPIPLSPPSPAKAQSLALPSPLGSAPLAKAPYGRGTWISHPTTAQGEGRSFSYTCPTSLTLQRDPWTPAGWEPLPALRLELEGTLLWGHPGLQGLHKVQESHQPSAGLLSLQGSPREPKGLDAEGHTECFRVWGKICLCAFSCLCPRKFIWSPPGMCAEGPGPLEAD